MRNKPSCDKAFNTISLAQRYKRRNSSHCRSISPILRVGVFFRICNKVHRQIPVIIDLIVRKPTMATCPSHSWDAVSSFLPLLLEWNCSRKSSWGHCFRGRTFYTLWTPVWMLHFEVVFHTSRCKIPFWYLLCNWQRRASQFLSQDILLAMTGIPAVWLGWTDTSHDEPLFLR